MKVMLVAGETSGDHHAAHVVQEILRESPKSSVFGMGGSHLRAAGMETIVDSETAASVMGLTEVFAKFGTIVRAFKILVAAAAERKPDVAVLVDYPDFNLRLAKRLHGMGIRVVYFITPQIWAWRTGRVRQIKRYVDKVLPIIPFEESFYRSYGVDVSYVGHPFLDRPAHQMSRKQYRAALGLREDLPLLALLPGSRKAEIEKLLEPLVLAYGELRARRPGLQAILPVAESLDIANIEERVSALGVEGIHLVYGKARDVLAAADVAIIASGTATVEAALEEVPFVLVYKLSPITYFFGRLLVRKVKFVGMVNLIAGKKVIEELLQERANPAEIAMEMERFLGDPKRTEDVRLQLCEIKSKLAADLDTDTSSAKRVAMFVLQSTGESPKKNAAQEVAHAA